MNTTRIVSSADLTRLVLASELSSPCGMHSPERHGLPLAPHAEEGTADLSLLDNAPVFMAEDTLITDEMLFSAPEAKAVKPDWKKIYGKRRFDGSVNPNAPRHDCKASKCAIVCTFGDW